MEGYRERPRWTRRIPRWAIVTAVVLVAIGVFAAVFDWNWFKGPVERRVSQATGREFRIGGNLDVDFGRAIRIRMDRPRLANASWSARDTMAQAERAEIDVAFWPLFKGDVALRAVNLVKPRLLLERSDSGEANWEFRTDRRKEGAGVAPQIDRLVVQDGRVEVLEPKLKTRLDVRVHSGKAERPEVAPPLLIDGGGRYRDGDFDVRGRIDSPLELLERDEPYRLDIRARAGATLAHARGVLRSAVQFRDFDVDVLLAGDDLARLYPLLGLALPETPPFEFHGRLTHAGGVWRYSDFIGRMGDSDVSGDVSIDINGERPALSGRVASRRLDFDDLAGMIGAAPQTAEGESASEQQRARAAQRAASPTVLPNNEFNLQKLRSMDADVTVHAASINTRRLPLESITARVHLKDGMLTLEPLEVGAAGGTLQGKITLDASVDPIATTTDLTVRGIELPKIFPKMNPQSTGEIAGIVQLAGKGNSVAAMLGTSDGNLDLVMGPARISNLLVELAGLDVAESLRYAVGEDRMIGVRCAYAEFDVDEGLATSQALVFDTTDTAIVGAGRIDFRNEKLDLELRPQPKDPSPLVVRVPLEIQGTLKDPSFRPKAGPLVARAAAAAALYALAPPAALLALLEPGPGENVACGEAVAESEVAKQKEQQKKEPQRAERPETGEEKKRDKG